MSDSSVLHHWTETAVIALVLALTAMTYPSQAGKLQPLAGTYIVNSDGNAPDANPGDGICDTGSWLSYCTLHAAIQEANLSNVHSRIEFAAPMTISSPSLPIITKDGIVIDASNQWDGTWPGGRPGVRIGGANYTNGLLPIQARNVVVYGIEFYGSNSIGVYISGSGGSNVIGGTSTGQRNVFLNGTGIRMQCSGVGNVVVGNYFGTWDGDSAIASDTGVYIQSNSNVVESNLIMGHASAGILIWNGDNNVLTGNTIGANKSRTAPRPNAIGVRILEGDTNLVLDSFIAGNTGYGVELWHANGTIISDNKIGYASYSLGNGSNGIHAYHSNNNHFGTEDGNQIVGNGGYGVWLDGDDNYIEGNTIANNGQDGVYIEYGQENRVGSGSTGWRNDIRDNGGHGVHLATGAISTTVRSNAIGLLVDAWDAGNGGHGILIDGGARANRIGGLGSGDGNWIGFNDQSGIYISGSTTQGNIVEGNVIGAPANWRWPAPNGHHGIGIYDGAHDNWIGWGNTIASSSWSGVAIVNGSDNNVVWFNYIGTDDTGDDWGNGYWGINVVNSAGNLAFGNAIAYNDQAGVRIDGGLAGNPINANSIHDNSGAGIELANGGNFGLGAPTITQATCAGQPQTLGRVEGTSCLGCTVEIFTDTADEGRVFEGWTMADGSTGAFTWSGMLDGPNVTATGTTATGATSAFSAPSNVGPCVIPQVFIPFVAR